MNFSSPAERLTSAEITGQVRAEIARRQISIDDLARALGKSVATTRRRLDGTYPLTVDELARIADLLGVSVSDIVTRARQAVSA